MEERDVGGYGWMQVWCGMGAGVLDVVWMQVLNMGVMECGMGEM